MKNKLHYLLILFCFLSCAKEDELDTRITPVYSNSLMQVDSTSNQSSNTQNTLLNELKEGSLTFQRLDYGNGVREEDFMFHYVEPKLTIFDDWGWAQYENVELVLEDSAIILNTETTLGQKVKFEIKEDRATRTINDNIEIYSNRK